MRKANILLRKIVRLQREEKIIPPGSSLLVALSGGVDSVVLTKALIELRGFLRIERLAVAHFNHQLRKESESEEKFCISLAEELGIEIFTGREDVREVSRRHKRNLEETARELRYTFLRKVKESEGFTLIATAHHLNDLLETALLWFTRGSGLEGLLGFEPKEGDVVRPLYRTTREEILSFAREFGLKWVEDASNYDDKFFRNRLRHEVIPLLKTINPNIEETFLRMRTILKEENELLESIAKEKLIEVSGKGCIEVAKLKSLPIAIQRRVLRMFSSVRSFDKIEQMRRLLSKGGYVELGKNMRAVRKGKFLCLKKADAKPIF